MADVPFDWSEVEGVASASEFIAECDDEPEPAADSNDAESGEVWAEVPVSPRADVLEASASGALGAAAAVAAAAAILVWANPKSSVGVPRLPASVRSASAFTVFSWFVGSLSFLEALAAIFFFGAAFFLGTDFLAAVFFFEVAFFLVAVLLALWVLFPAVAAVWGSWSALVLSVLSSSAIVTAPSIWMDTSKKPHPAIAQKS